MDEIAQKYTEDDVSLLGKKYSAAALELRRLQLQETELRSQLAKNKASINKTKQEMTGFQSQLNTALGIQEVVQVVHAKVKISQPKIWGMQEKKRKK